MIAIWSSALSHLKKKACFVAGGHQTDNLKESTYYRVLSCDSIHIALMIAGLNNLNMSAKIQNAYINSPTKEKVYTIGGLEFGKENMGRPVLIIHALYSLKSSSTRWRDHMASTLWDLGFKGCLADPDE